MIRMADGQVRTLPVQDIRIEPRLGNTPRILRLPDGTMLETADHGTVARLEAQVRPANSWLHRLESRWTAVLVATVLAIAVLLGTVTWGIPALAGFIAGQIPAPQVQQLGPDALDWLDTHVFSPSNLPEARRNALQEQFDTFIRSSEFRYRLHFRASPKLGANALALPSGDIILTDELVALAEDDNELMAVLLHEQGHVEKRHGLRLALQQASVVTLVTLMTGDLSTASSAITALPLLLTQLGYSRDMEREADAYAVLRMRETGLDTGAFVRILRKLAASHGEEQASTGFLSTHPVTDERIAAIRASR